MRFLWIFIAILLAMFASSTMAQGTQPYPCIMGGLPMCITYCIQQGCAVGRCDNPQSCICDRCNAGSGPPPPGTK
ncbi:unnamed protein product [Rotaria socialis]|uniref:Uncharacterized protein n=1 Tax=Rotaria socialis TaxID=392032 RepID=A0A817PFL1_9BILA|nr:unnamed protein product [Rotaria socialis]CAF3502670.1 unnamed protein product [Rotaria socialis]CAF3526780.1 unnamed protein product [Rotaria socialis]CAF3609954.1 unnamed protein product [Rotaria socialis]CAF3770565.1 unnamed protein product [Rotaria socialis]